MNYRLLYYESTVNYGERVFQSHLVCIMHNTHLPLSITLTGNLRHLQLSDIQRGYYTLYPQRLISMSGGIIRHA